MYKGIDVSSYQGIIEWDIVKRQGIDFVIQRLGYGKNNIDKYAIRNLTECNKRNIDVGGYWFSYAYTVEMARQEARHVLKLVKDYNLTYPIYYDFENDTKRYALTKGVKITKKLFNDMCIAFCEEIEQAGYYAGIYTNKDYLKNMLYPTTLKRFDLWYAQYNKVADYKANIWQFTDKGKVNGIVGNVDLNVSTLNFPKLLKERGLNRLK